MLNTNEFEILLKMHSTKYLTVGQVVMKDEISNGCREISINKI